MAEYAKALGSCLREVRKRAGLSLQAVEQKSDGHWKGVVAAKWGVLPPGARITAE